MFENVGKKIQGLAAFLLWFGIIVSIGSGIASWVLIDDEVGVVAFLAAAIIGSVGAYIFSLFLCAIGKITEDAENRLAEKEVAQSSPKSVEEKKPAVKTIPVKEKHKEKLEDDEDFVDVVCPNCNEELSFLSGTTEAECPICGKKINISTL